MPAYPNPYGPRNSIGAGLDSIAKAIFKSGDYELGNRRIVKQTEEQAAERLAHAQERESRMRLLDSQTTEQEQQNLSRTPNALAQYGADAANLPAHIYRGITSLPPEHFDLDQGPAPSLRYADADISAARIGRQLASAFAANNAPNPEQFAKAGTQYDMRGDRNKVIEGQLAADLFGEAQAGFEGKPRYGFESGIQFSNQVADRTAMTPLGTAKVSTEKTIAGKNTAQARQADAAANLSNVRANAGGFAPRAASGAGGEKRKALTKAEMTALENQLADLVGVEFGKIDPKARASLISRASALAVDPQSEFHRNPSGAMQAAVAEMAPDGFEDSAGVFSSAKFVPKGKQKAAAPGAFDPDKEKRYQEWKARQGA